MNHKITNNNNSKFQIINHYQLITKHLKNKYFAEHYEPILLIVITNYQAKEKTVGHMFECFSRQV
jgi:hypothetical protein